MNRDKLIALLQSVRAQTTSPEAAVDALSDLPFVELTEAFATLDTHRAIRTGVPEAVYGEGKSEEQLLKICTHLLERGDGLLVTRLSAERGARLEAALGAGYDPVSQIYLRAAEHPLEAKGPPVVVVSAGSSDQKCAAEAAVVARACGANVETISDVGVAGLHRLRPHLETLRRAGVLVVVAGMEGALPSVLAGLTGQPVIAVPSSVGYGASFGGVTALLAMLSSCAPGVSVVNIDNGYGAGHLAASLARRMIESASTQARSDSKGEAHGLVED